MLLIMRRWPADLWIFPLFLLLLQQYAGAAAARKRVIAAMLATNQLFQSLQLLTCSPAHSADDRLPANAPAPFAYPPPAAPPLPLLLPVCCCCNSAAPSALLENPKLLP